MSNRKRLIVGLMVLVGGFILTGCAVQVQAPYELTSAIRSGNVDKVKSILEENPKLVNSRTEGRHLLHHVLYFSPNIELAKKFAEFLIANGANVNAKDNRGQTLLHVLRCSKNWTAFLIENGANVNAKDNDGRTPLYMACNAFGLIGEGDPDQGFERKCGEDCEDCAKFLIDKGADVKIRTDEGSVLTGAVQCGYTEIVALVISKGAKVNVKAAGCPGTPLHYAARKGHKELAELLIAGGANVNAKNVRYIQDYGRNLTPLHFAVRGGHKDIAEFLIAAGADVNAKYDYSTSEQAFVESFPLDRRISLMIFSLFRHEDTNWWFPSKGEAGLITPLHLAARKGHNELAELLIANGADVNAKDKDGKTPLDLASDTQLAELLRKHGAVE